MSRLQIYRPQGSVYAPTWSPNDDADGPTILPFRASLMRGTSRGSIDLLIRARAIYRNQRCPYCRQPVVEPLVLDDAVYSRDNLPIPGTGTLVGFRCDGCHAEWPTSTG